MCVMLNRISHGYPGGRAAVYLQKCVRRFGTNVFATSSALAFFLQTWRWVKQSIGQTRSKVLTDSCALRACAEMSADLLHKPQTVGLDPPQFSAVGGESLGRGPSRTRSRARSAGAGRPPRSSTDLVDAVGGEASPFPWPSRRSQHKPIHRPARTFLRAAEKGGFGETFGTRSAYTPNSPSGTALLVHTKFFHPPKIANSPASTRAASIAARTLSLMFLLWASSLLKSPLSPTSDRAVAITRWI